MFNLSSYATCLMLISNVRCLEAQQSDLKRNPMDRHFLRKIVIEATCLADSSYLRVKKLTVNKTLDVLRGPGDRDDHVLLTWHVC